MEAVCTWTYISALTSLAHRLNKEYDSYVRSLEITKEDQDYECKYANWWTRNATPMLSNQHHTRQPWMNVREPWQVCICLQWSSLRKWRCWFQSITVEENENLLIVLQRNMPRYAKICLLPLVLLFHLHLSVSLLHPSLPLSLSLSKLLAHLYDWVPINLKGH